VNVRGNSDRVKVEQRTALVKSGYMLENLVHPALLWYNIVKV